MKAKTAFLSLLFLFMLCLPSLPPHNNNDDAIPEYSDVYWLALNMYHEAGNQSEKGKAAVGIVTLNRLYHPELFETTIERVVKEHKQFSWYHLKKNHRPMNQEVWNECVRISVLLLTQRYNPAIIAELDGVTHFHATYVKPKWKNYLIKVAQIGDHIFYKMKG
jgi:N-acetylmuramoyl-L-alanine amidase